MGKGRGRAPVTTCGIARRRYVNAARSEWPEACRRVAHEEPWRGRASDFAWGVTPCRRARTASEVRGVSGVSLLGVLRRPAEPHQRRTRNALPGLWRQTRQRRLQSGVRRSAPLVTLRGRVVGGVQAMVIRRGPVARSGRGSPRSGRPRAPGRKSASRRSGPGCLPGRRRGPRGLREGRKSRSSVSR